MSADLPKMPEPACTAGIARAMHNDATELYTADQMRTFAQEAARQALLRAYDAMFDISGDKVTRFNAQIAIRTPLPQDMDHLAGVGNMVEAPTSGNGEGEKQ